MTTIRATRCGTSAKHFTRADLTSRGRVRGYSVWIEEKPKAGAANSPVSDNKTGRLAPVEPTTAVKSSTPFMRPGVGEIWLTGHGSAQQSSRDCQGPSNCGNHSALQLMVCTTEIPASASRRKLD